VKKFLQTLVGGVSKASKVVEAKPKARPALEALEDRMVLTNQISWAPAALFAPNLLSNMARTIQVRGPATTSHDFYTLGLNERNQAMNRDPVTRQIGQMNSLTANNFVLNDPTVNRFMLQRDPVTHLSPAELYGIGTTPLQHQAVANDIAAMSQGATNINWLGVADKYGIKGYLPGAGYAQDSAYQSFGYLQNGASFFARRPDGTQARPSDYGTLPYNNSQVFDPTKINYSNPYDNPWNRPSTQVAAAPARPLSGPTSGYGVQVATPAVGWRATQTAAPAYNGWRATQTAAPAYHPATVYHAAPSYGGWRRN
jgi:hypothetical protein